MDNRQREIRRPPVPIFATKKPRTALFAHPNNPKTDNEVSSTAYTAKSRGPAASNSSWNSGVSNKWQQQPAAQTPSWQPAPQPAPWGRGPTNPQPTPAGQGYSSGPYGAPSNMPNQQQCQYQPQSHDQYNGGQRSQQYQGPPQQPRRSQNTSCSNTMTAGNPSFTNSTTTGRQQTGSSSWPAQQAPPRGPTTFRSLQSNNNSGFTGQQSNYNFQTKQSNSWNDRGHPSSHQSPSPNVSHQGWSDQYNQAPSPRYGHTAGRPTQGYNPPGPLPTVQPWGLPDLPAMSRTASGSVPFSGAQEQENVPSAQLPPDEVAAPSRVVDKSLKVLAATVQGMRHWAQYKDKTPLLFELVGRMDSALSTNPKLGCKEFMLRDDKEDTMRCMFFEIDRQCPRLVRGQFYRCVGSVENGTLHCVTVRAAADPEKRLQRVRVAASDRAMRHWVATEREL